MKKEIIEVDGIFWKEFMDYWTESEVFFNRIEGFLTECDLHIRPNIIVTTNCNLMHNTMCMTSTELQ